LKKIIITIDGPAASGKERIAKYICKKWGLKHLDTGTLYRNIAKYFKEKNVNLRSINDIKKNLDAKKNLSFRKDKSLRSEEISKIASKIAVFGLVRDYVNKYQKYFVKKNVRNKGFVIDGRDIGSVVFKNADLKLYIDVNEINRAKRRYKQLIDSGEKSIYPKILKDIKLRDQKDRSRKHSPLIKPRDAIVINNNGSFTETIKQINSVFENSKI